MARVSTHFILFFSGSRKKSYHPLTRGGGCDFGLTRPKRSEVFFRPRQSHYLSLVGFKLFIFFTPLHPTFPTRPSFNRPLAEEQITSIVLYVGRTIRYAETVVPINHSAAHAVNRLEEQCNNDNNNEDRKHAPRERSLLGRKDLTATAEFSQRDRKRRATTPTH
jgi:hypothetical protein